VTNWGIKKGERGRPRVAMAECGILEPRAIDGKREDDNTKNHKMKNGQADETPDSSAGSSRLCWWLCVACVGGWSWMEGREQKEDRAATLSTWFGVPLFRARDNAFRRVFSGALACALKPCRQHDDAKLHCSPAAEAPPAFVPQRARGLSNQFAVKKLPLQIYTSACLQCCTSSLDSSLHNDSTVGSAACCQRDSLAMKKPVVRLASNWNSQYRICCGFRRPFGGSFSVSHKNAIPARMASSSTQTQPEPAAAVEANAEQASAYKPRYIDVGTTAAPGSVFPDMAPLAVCQCLDLEIEG